MSHLFRLAVVALLGAAVILALSIGIAKHTAALLGPFQLLVFFLAMLLYLTPTALAFHRQCDAIAWITALNIVFGWTVFGWVLALGWAASGKVRVMRASAPAPPVQPVHRPG